jgi:hypothetical protein
MATHTVYSAARMVWPLMRVSLVADGRPEVGSKKVRIHSYSKCRRLCKTNEDAPCRIPELKSDSDEPRTQKAR